MEEEEEDETTAKRTKAETTEKKNDARKDMICVDFLFINPSIHSSMFRRSINLLGVKTTTTTTKEQQQRRSDRLSRRRRAFRLFSSGWMEGPKQPRAREIEDSFLDEYLIARFSDGLSKVLLPKGGEGGEGTKSDDTNFKRDVGEKCVRIVRDSASAEEQRAKGLRVIDAFFPEPIPPLFGRFLKLFPGWFARRWKRARRL